MHVDDAILGIGTALPPHAVTQAVAARVIAESLPEGHPDRLVIPRLFLLSGVRTRYSSVPDFRGDVRGPLLAGAPLATSGRMDLFALHAPPLALRAARAALADARLQPCDVHHVVAVTCTGLAAPGIDVAICRGLGLDADVGRTLVAFMGCHGAFNGLRVARALARGGANVLLVCVELCSLHVDVAGGRDALVPAALFGDGAAGVVVGSTRRRPALLVPGADASRLIPDDGTHMAWEIGERGFRMRLSSYVPALVSTDLGAHLEPSLRGRDVSAWCVHPGGPAILRAVQASLGLPRPALDVSRAVLRDIGNVSSATVLFVLERALSHMAPGDFGAMLGFGPGLTIETLAFQRGTARSGLGGRPLEAPVAAATNALSVPPPASVAG